MECKNFSVGCVSLDISFSSVDVLSHCCRCCLNRTCHQTLSILRYFVWLFVSVRFLPSIRLSFQSGTDDWRFPLVLVSSSDLPVLPLHTPLQMTERNERPSSMLMGLVADHFWVERLIDAMNCCIYTFSSMVQNLETRTHHESHSSNYSPKLSATWSMIVGASY